MRRFPPTFIWHQDPCSRIELIRVDACNLPTRRGSVGQPQAPANPHCRLPCDTRQGRKRRVYETYAALLTLASTLVVVVDHVVKNEDLRLLESSARLHCRKDCEDVDRGRSRLLLVLVVVVAAHGFCLPHRDPRRRQQQWLRKIACCGSGPWRQHALH